MKSPYLPVAIQAVKAAEKIILQHYQSNLAVQTKADMTPVTIADQQAEEIIKQTILAAFPDHTFFGEEGEKVDLETVARRDRHDIVPLPQLRDFDETFADDIACDKVGLRDNRNGCSPPCDLAQLVGDVAVTGPDFLVGRHAETDDVDLCQCCSYDVVEPLTEKSARLVKSRCVDENELRIWSVHDAADSVPRGLRPVAHDGDLLSDECVGQRRLAGVGTTHEAGESRAEGVAHSPRSRL